MEGETELSISMDRMYLRTKFRVFYSIFSAIDRVATEFRSEGNKIRVPQFSMVRANRRTGAEYESLSTRL